MQIDAGLDIICDYGDFVVVRKPSGLLSVPGRTEDRQDCVCSRLREIYPECIAQPAVHRLDWETSGIILMAKTKEVHRALSIQFQERIVEKRYIALLDGIVDGEGGRIELPFRLDLDNKPHQIYDEIYGKWGTTLWRKISDENGQSRIEFTPLTGRTHQLRLHSYHPKGLGIPIIGDCLYGSGTEVNQLRLHAAYLKFQHPHTGEWIEIHSEPLW